MSVLENERDEVILKDHFSSIHDSNMHLPADIGAVNVVKHQVSAGGSSRSL